MTLGTLAALAALAALAPQRSLAAPGAPGAPAPAPAPASAADAAGDCLAFAVGGGRATLVVDRHVVVVPTGGMTVLGCESAVFDEPVVQVNYLRADRVPDSYRSVPADRGRMLRERIHVAGSISDYIQRPADRARSLIGGQTASLAPGAGVFTLDTVGRGDVRARFLASGDWDGGVGTNGGMVGMPAWKDGRLGGKRLTLAAAEHPASGAGSAPGGAPGPFGGLGDIDKLLAHGQGAPAGLAFGASPQGEVHFAAEACRAGPDGVECLDPASQPAMAAWLDAAAQGRLAKGGHYVLKAKGQPDLALTYVPAWSLPEAMSIGLPHTLPGASRPLPGLAGTAPAADLAAHPADAATRLLDRLWVEDLLQAASDGGRASWAGARGTSSAAARDALAQALARMPGARATPPGVADVKMATRRDGAASSAVPRP